MTGRRARSTSAIVDERHFVFACGVGIDATVVERVDAHPRLKSKAGPYYYSWAGSRASTASTCVNPVRRAGRDRRRRAGRGRHRDRPELRPLHLLRQPPDPRLRGDRDRRRHALARRPQARHPARHADPDRRLFSETSPPPATARSSTSTTSPTATVSSVSEDKDGVAAALPAAGRRRLHRRAHAGRAARRPRRADDRRLSSAARGGPPKGGRPLSVVASAARAASRRLRLRSPSSE